MADESKEPLTRGRMKIGRIRIGLNVVVQVVLILFLAAMVNSLAFKHYKRWDFSRDQKYALSDKTKRFLDTLKGKMRITVFFSPSTPITAETTTGATKQSRPRRWPILTRAGWRQAKVRGSPHSKASRRSPAR